MTSPVEPGNSLGLRERKKLRQRERIIETTLELVRAHGYEGTTVEQIVRSLEISQPTFYNYFSSKDAVLAEVARRAGKKLASVMHADSAPHAPTFDRLDRVRTVMSDWIEADKPLWRAIIQANALNLMNHPELREERGAGLEVVSQILAEGQERGEVTTRLSVDRLVLILEGMQAFAFAHWAADFPEPHSLDESLRRNFDFFIRAARPDPDETRPRPRMHEDAHG